MQEQYAAHLSGFSGWKEAEHAEDWLLFPENMGEYYLLTKQVYPKELRSLPTLWRTWQKNICKKIAKPKSCTYICNRLVS